MNRTRLLWAAVASLALLNIVTIATVIYGRYNRQPAQSIQLEPGGSVLNGRYMRQHLGFDARQIQVFRTQHRQFHHQANQVIEQIGQTKATLFFELHQEQPDSLAIVRSAEHIGHLHAQLKQYTAQFYLGLRACCNPQQQQQLEVLFIPLFLDADARAQHSCHSCRRGGGR